MQSVGVVCPSLTTQKRMYQHTVGTFSFVSECVAVHASLDSKWRVSRVPNKDSVCVVYNSVLAIVVLILCAAYTNKGRKDMRGICQKFRHV